MRGTGLACLATLLAAGCMIDDLQHDKRYCSTEYPCAEGFLCVQNQCAKKGGPVDPDGPGPVTDGPVDVPPPPTETTLPDVFSGEAPGPKLDGPLDDQKPIPDAGCPTGYTDCGGMCVDLTVNFDHCGNCFAACDPGVSDRCANGACRCGSLSPLCLSGLNCVAGTCSCISGPTSRCNGCCQNGACLSGTSPNACGVGGNPCGACKPAATCNQVTCNTGVCTHSPMPNGSSCNAPELGMCYGGSCCTGCWNGTACMAGTSSSACGRFGVACKICQLPLVCQGGNCTIIQPPPP